MVITLIAIVASVAISVYEHSDQDARINTTRYEMQEIKSAILHFRRDLGDLPNSIAQLTVCQSTETTANGVTTCTAWNRDTQRGWHGPYITLDAANDAWGNAYAFYDNTDQTPIDDSDGVARIVSAGDNAGFENTATTDQCTPVTNSDDIVLCLLK